MDKETAKKLLDEFAKCVDYQRGNENVDEVLDNLERDIKYIRKNNNL